MEYFDCEYNAIGRDKAGVIVSNGGSKVFGILNGPFEPSGSIVDLYAATVRVTITASNKNRIEYASLQETLEKILSSAIHIRDYPRCILDVKLYVLSSVNNIMAAIVNTISVILVNAGIQMKGVLLANCKEESRCTAVYIYSNNTYTKVAEIGEHTEICHSRLNDLLERMVYSLRDDYKKDWLLK